MNADEIARRLDEVRERIRRELEASEPPRITADLPEQAPLRLDERPELAIRTDPAVATTPHLQEANRLAEITGPIRITSGVRIIGPLLTLVRRLARPFVQPFLDPYLSRQERFNAEVVRHLNELGDRLEARFVKIRDDLLDRAPDPFVLEGRLESALSDYDETLRRRHALLFDGLEEELWALRGAIQDAAAGLAGGLHGLEVRFVQRAQAVDRRFDEKDEALERAVRTRSAGLKEAELLETRSLLQRMLERAPAGAQREPATPGPDDPLWGQLRDWMRDEDYRAFQDRFRGDAGEIRARLREHVEAFRDAPGIVADLGCGRGEFLDLLREEGIAAVGVEINAADVQECRRRGHEAETADLFAWLEARPEGSLGGVFLAQVIEHLPPPHWSRFVALAASRLAPGGRLLVETINPESLYALGRAYVLDPTHTRPVHPELLAFFAERAGLVDLEVRLQAPVPDGQRLETIDEEAFAEDPGALELARELNRRIQRINRICCAPQEYALAATRPGAGREEP